MKSSQSQHHTQGLIYAFLAYGWWGIAPPFYFKSLAHVPALEILAHRIVWSLPLLLGLMLWHKQLPEFVRCFRSWRILRLLLLSTFLIGLNWFVYIYCVVTDQIVQGSLGYFINPLMNVVLGVLFFHERLRVRQRWAVGLATAGVVLMTITSGQLPWIALTLALAFGLYGVLRKIMPVDGTVSLSVEMSLLLPVSLGWLAFLSLTQQMQFSQVNWQTDTLLLCGAIITVFPLICFGLAAQRLPLTTLGFIQYLAPSSQIVLGVFWNGEQLHWLELVSFVFIWIGLVIYSVDSILRYRSTRGKIAAAPPQDFIHKRAKKAITPMVQKKL